MLSISISFLLHVHTCVHKVNLKTAKGIFNTVELVLLVTNCGHLLWQIHVIFLMALRVQAKSTFLMQPIILVPIERRLATFDWFHYIYIILYVHMYNRVPVCVCMFVCVCVYVYLCV
jgi:hypothetical protein